MNILAQLLSESNGTPSTMRVISLFLVITVCLVVIASTFNGKPVSFDLVTVLLTAAIAGKVGQKMIEPKDISKTEIK